MICLRTLPWRQVTFRPVCRSLSTQLIGQEQGHGSSTTTASRQAAIQRNSQLFDELMDKQRTSVARVEKIQINVQNIGPYPDMCLLMNKHLSTPFHCAQHVSQLFVERSVYAKLNDDQLWDMHRPLDQDCTLTFHHFKEDDTLQANRIFWRSCSFLLGKVIQDTFKESIPLHLHSWPKPNFKLGSFIYDVQLPSLSDWKPSETELITLTKVFVQLQSQNLPIQRLSVHVDLATKLFDQNPFKLQQLKEIANRDANAQVNVYRVDQHLDFSVGPMIPHTGFVGRVSITAVHPIESQSIGKLYRFQGVALPLQLPMHSYPFKVLCDRSRQLNSSPIP